MREHSTYADFDLNNAYNWGETTYRAPGRWESVESTTHDLPPTPLRAVATIEDVYDHFQRR